MDWEYFTEEGLKKAKAELRDLKFEKRPVISQKVAAARELGDLKENAEYHAAREELSLMESKIKMLESKVSRAKIINEDEIATDKAYILSTVVLKDLKWKDTLEYTLVSAAEADAGKNRISVDSPMGKALLGKAIGEQVEVQAPAGKLMYEILDIKR